jgi:hypothetical protein
MGSDRAIAPAGAAEAQGRPTAGAGSGDAHRPPVRAPQRDSVGAAAPGDGLWQRRHLLAPAARLAARGRLGPLTSHPAGSARESRPDRLVPRQPGQSARSGKKGGPVTGRKPTDRGRPGSKQHVLNDRQGIPLALGLSAANYADSLTLAPMLDTVQPIKRPLGRPRKRPAKLDADKAYDPRHCRAEWRARHVIPRLARRAGPRGPAFASRGRGRAMSGPAVNLVPPRPVRAAGAVGGSTYR